MRHNAEAAPSRNDGIPVAMSVSARSEWRRSTEGVSFAEANDSALGPRFLVVSFALFSHHLSVVVVAVCTPHAARRRNPSVPAQFRHGFLGQIDGRGDCAEEREPKNDEAHGKETLPAFLAQEISGRSKDKQSEQQRGLP